MGETLDEVTRKEMVLIREDIRRVAERVASIEAKIDDLHSSPCPLLLRQINETQRLNQSSYTRLLNGLILAMIGGLVSLAVAVVSGVLK